MPFVICTYLRAVGAGRQLHVRPGKAVAAVLGEGVKGEKEGKRGK